MDEPQPVLDELPEFPLVTEFCDLPPRGVLLTPRRFCKRFFWLLGFCPSTGLHPLRTALIVSVIGSLTIVLSVLSSSAVVTVRLTDGITSYVREFGYLYDPSAGLFFAFVGPAVLYAGLRFLNHAQQNMFTMHRQQRLLVQVQGSARVSNIHSIRVIAGANRVVFNWPVIFGLFVGAVAFTLLQEFRPGGDRSTMPFGYVQADVVAAYRTDISLCDALGSRSKRLDGIDKLVLHDLNKVRIAGPPDGPSHAQLPVFWIFVFLAMANHSLFALLAFWIVLKVWFVLWIYVASIANGTDQCRSAVARSLNWLLARFVATRDAGEQTNVDVSALLTITIDPFDANKRFGLTPLLFSLGHLGVLLTLCVASLFLEIVRNIAPYPDYLQRAGNLGTLWTLVTPHSLIALEGPGGGGFVSIAIFAACLWFYCCVRGHLNRYREAVLARPNLTKDQSDVLMARNVNAVIVVLVVSVGAVRLIQYLLNPKMVVDAALLWKGLAEKIGTRMA